MSSLNVQPSGRHGVRPSWRAGVSARVEPKRNGLLAALGAETYERLLPKLRPVELVGGSTIYDADEREGYLYFLTAGIVVRFLVMHSGVSAAISVTGSEGVVGVASFLGGQSTLNRAVVVSSGYAYRLPGDSLRDEVRHSGPLLQLLLRYTQALITQTAQVVACNRHHTVEQQICRWILTCLDRAPAGELGMTQQLMADVLGVRRESVTEGAAKLQAAGLIQYSRGKIAVLDRAQLEQRACECYAAIRTESDRLLPRKSAPSDLPPATCGQFVDGHMS
jgi:CRP-like cAMP-binding protein